MFRIKQIFLLVLLLLLRTVYSFASEESYFNELRGSSVSQGSSLYVTDEKFRLYSATEWGKLNNYSVKNYVSFELNVDTSLYFYSKPFSATLNVTIHFYADKSDTSLETSPAQTIDLKINFDTAKGSIYKAVALYKFQGAFKFKVVINSISSPEYVTGIPDIFRVTGKTVIERQYLFDDTSTDVSVFQLINPGQLRVSWTPANYPGAEQFDLEWTIVDSLSVVAGSIRNSLVSGQVSTNLSLDTLELWFRNNASRITTTGSSYTLNLASNSGYLLYRIRGVQIFHDNNLRYEGNWNYLSTASPGGSNQYAIVPIGWHQANLNWQYTASFAEEGKRKEVIQYFDGSLRNRQSVTLDNNNQVAVVQEAVYDPEGRQAAAILPAPVNENILKYFPGFNLNGNSVPYSFSDLAFGTNCRVIPGILATTSGTSQYYSPSNTFNTLHRDYIPDAKGFPVAVTEFTPDNTGRITSQGGVGPEYQPGSGHETRYFYGKPTQTELDRLFGSEAGNASHYLKNMVVDPNGQVSVSYVNASGKTVATALAGKVPDSLSALPAAAGASTFISDDLISNEDMIADVNNYLLSASATFTAPLTGNYQFNYSLDPQQLKLLHGNANQYTLCSSCYYDLQIQVKDNCNTVLQSFSRPAGLLFDPSCTSPTPIADSFAVSIDAIGEYHVSYDLVISRNALNYYDSANLANNTNIRKQSSFVSEELRKMDFSNCFTNCETCLEDLGTVNDFLDRFRGLYLADSLTLIPEDSLYIIDLYNQELANCNLLRLGSGCQKSPCAEKLELIKSDLAPGQQYALFDLTTYQPLAPLAINVLTKYASVQSFPDENGQPDSVTLKSIDGSDSVRLPVNQLSVRDFIINWKNSWADSLARFHPEYCYYLWCTNQSQYYGFDEMVKNSISTGDIAIAGGYYDKNDYMALLNKDPFFNPVNRGNDSTYYKEMRDNLHYFSRGMVGYSQEDKNIIEVLKIMLYCKNRPSPWEGCLIDDSCRSLNREWEIYKQLYFNAKEAYYERARLADPNFSNCRNCYIGNDALDLSRTDTLTIGPGRGNYIDSTFFNPQLNCVNGCQDSIIYQDYNRPGVSYFVKLGSRQSMPSVVPSGYIHGSYFSSFSIATGKDSACTFYNVWIFVKDTSNVTTVISLPESSCSADTLASLYAGKIRRFAGYVNTSQFISQGLSGNPQYETALQNGVLNAAYQSSCDAKAELWIQTLANCVHSGNALADSLALDSLKKEFVRICAAGSATGSVNGAMSAPSTIGLPFSSFEAAIKGILGNDAINTQCAVELLSGAYPYDKQPLSDLPIIDESNYDICSNLTTFKNAYLNSGFSGSFYQYLVNEIGRGFHLTEAQLNDLERSCINCYNIIDKAIQLPLPFISGRRTFISCTTADSLQTAFANKFPGIEPGNNTYETLLSNFCNQSLGFGLTYDDYSAFFSSSCPVNNTAKLYDVATSPAFLLSNNSCVADLFSIAASNARLRYQNYIDSVRADFREAYLNRCLAARGSVKMKSELKEYHYTLYYYDQSDNLVKTIPPAGVVLLNAAQIDSVQNDRKYGRSDCYTFSDDLDFNGTAAKKFGHQARYNFGSRSFSVEADIRLTGYGDQAIISYYDTSAHRGYRLFVKDGKLFFNLQQSDTAYYTVNTNAISGFIPLNQWVHIVAVRNLSIRNKRSAIIVDGNSQPVTDDSQNFGFFSSIDPLALNTELLIGAEPEDSLPKLTGRIKQIRLYARALDVQEARQNYTNTCLLPAKQTGLVFWAPVNEGSGQIKDKLSADSSSDVNGSLTWIHNRTGIYPKHELPTIYVYNSLNQVVQQETPDAGISNFWYDRLGRLTASQNSEQLSPVNGGSSNRYSYTTYDVLGRIIEVGEKTGAAANMDTLNTLDNTVLQNWLGSGHNYQVTQTLYDTINTAIVTISGVTDNQVNLRKRVVSSLYKEDGAVSGYENATHYSYDINGNVKTLWQEIGKLRPYSDNGIKQVNYDYDIVSGKVNKVIYQPGKGDQFLYKYAYDAENRLTAAFSSRDGLRWATDAEYRYYLHGPLARTELGTNKVQGIDFAYTLQGWLKGMNTTNLAGATAVTGDMGGDGINGSRVSKDVAGFALHYFNGDYTGIGTNAQAFAALPGGGGTGGGALFNGNIAAMSVNLAGLSEPLLYRYSYDQLNRLVNKNVFNGLDTANHWTPIGLDDYKETLSYDANGNILTNLRNGTTTVGNPLAMDNLTYHYLPNTNKLAYVSDAVTAANYSSDIDDQSAGNYSYDKTGNLVADNAEGLQNVQWTVYGKIRAITKTAATINYAYDAAGNRVYKKLVTGTDSSSQVYVRDAQGNTLAVYKIKNDTATWAEQHLYGSSRLGMYNFNKTIPDAPSETSSGTPTLADSLMAGSTTYEITNHLGNVLSVISDKKTGVVSPTDTALVDYYAADLINTNDYYAFGMLMPGRNFNVSSYRYGFNGQEKSDKILNENTTAIFWEYDTRTGRRWNLDPKPTIGESDYSVNGNNPIINIDPLGDFKTKFGARVYKFFHGGKIKYQENGSHTGEWYVSKKGETLVNKDGSIEVTSIAIYNSKVSSAAEYTRGAVSAVADFAGFVFGLNSKITNYGQEDFETQQLMTSPGIKKGISLLKAQIANNTYDAWEGTQFSYSFSPDIKKVINNMIHFENPLNAFSQENKDAHVDVFKTQSWQKLYIGGYTGRIWKITSDKVLVQVINNTTANSLMIHMGEKLFETNGDKRFNNFWNQYTPFFHSNKQIFTFLMPLK